MADKEINTNKYFVELTDIGGGTIGYTVPFPEELLREIIKQNKQLTSEIQECEKYKKLAADFKDVNKQLGYKYLTIKDECEGLKRKVDEYKKALEEIEKVCIEDTRIFADGTEVRYDSLDKILDIINKAKGEGICQ